MQKKKKKKKKKENAQWRLVKRNSCRGLRFRMDWGLQLRSSWIAFSECGFELFTGRLRAKLFKWWTRIEIDKDAENPLKKEDVAHPSQTLLVFNK